MRPSLYDLFGQVPISTLDIEQWLLAVPRIRPDTRRAAWYVKAYNVPDKIKAAKLAGTFDDQVSHQDQDPRLDAMRWL